MKELAICGTFDDVGGKPSGYMRKIFEGGGAKVINGGNWDKLANLLNSVSDYDLVYWFPNVPNDKEKLVSEIKKINPKCILITSKNNQDQKYSHSDLIARALNSKSNLLLELTRKDNEILGTVHDPLGNIFAKDENNVDIVWATLYKRAKQLKGFTRVGSISIGEKLNIPNEDKFFNIIREYADRFHELVHAVNSGRLLGNASFRCERGFPSFRSANEIFVSRRNVDKRFIGPDGFVAVVPKISNQSVLYFGDIKPSVDTPIQVQLFANYQHVRYILHSHTYIDGALFTDKVIPCGALEEFDHIKSVYPDKNSSDFFVNLLGHGSIVLASDLSTLIAIPYIARPIPEEQKE